MEERGPLLAVEALVLAPVAAVVEGVLAVLALVRPGPRVDAPVTVQVAAAAE